MLLSVCDNSVAVIKEFEMEAFDAVKQVVESI